MAPKEPKGIAARNVSFSGPPVPKFLQKLHKEVNGARSVSHKSEFDDMLGTSVHRPTDDDDGKEEQPEEDEFDGAQVVVLKEGKHLSREEVLAAGAKEEPAAAAKGKGKEQAATAADDGSVAQPGASSSKKRRAPLSFDEEASDGKKAVVSSSSGGGEALADVKALIGASKTSKADKAAAKAEKKARKEQKKKAAIKIPAMAMDGDEEEQDFEQAGDADMAGETSVASTAPAAAEGEEQEEEVEALSHKEQRKRRKLEKAAAKAGVPLETLLPAKSKGKAAPVAPAAAAADAPKWGPKAAAAAAASQAALPRTGYSLWVGNLSFRTTAERLTEWFVEQGLDGVTRVYMPAGAKRGEANKGFAYVDVPDAAAVKEGIALSEGHLEGRRLLIKSGSDYAGRPALDATAVALVTIAAPTTAPGDDAAPKQGKTGLTKTAQKILRAQKNPPAPTLFVGNLSFQATADGLRELIENAARARDNSQWNSARKEEGEKKKVDKDADLKGTPEPEVKKPAVAEAEEESSESEAEDPEGGDKKEKKSKSATPAAAAKKQAPPKDGEIRGAGIRKIRMGEFEDSGKCKGFAFVDFFTPAHATATLIDPRCTRLDGRDITLQYAGADAVRRGAVKGSAAASAGTHSGDRAHKSGARPWAYGGERPAKRARDDAYAEGAEQTEEFLGPAPPKHFDPDAPVEKVHKPTREERLAKRAADAAAGRGGPQRRAKPGAALANAQRGQTGIVTEGTPATKITFD